MDFRNLFCGSLLCLSVGLSPAAADVASYTVVNQNVEGVLALIARDTGRRIDISGRVRTRIESETLSGTPDEMMEQVAALANLDWFAFDGVDYLSPRSDATTRLVRLGDLSFETVRTALEDADLLFDRYPLRLVAGGSAFVLSGPPKLLGMTEAMVESLPPSRAQEQNVAYVRERRGASSLRAVPVDGAGAVINLQQTFRSSDPEPVASEAEGAALDDVEIASNQTARADDMPAEGNE